jgi:hypothetical protein
MTITPKPLARDLNELVVARSAAIMDLLRSSGPYSAASLAHKLRFARGESDALDVLRPLESSGQVEKYNARGCLMWRAVPGKDAA